MTEFPKDLSPLIPTDAQKPPHRPGKEVPWTELITELDGEEAAAQFLINQKTEEEINNDRESIDELKARIGGLKETRGALKRGMDTIKRKQALGRFKKFKEPEYQYFVARIRHINSEVRDLERAWEEEEKVHLKKFSKQIKVDPQDLFHHRMFGGHDLLMERPDIIHGIEEVLAISEVPEVKEKTYTGYLGDSLEHEVLPNLVYNHHYSHAIDLWDLSVRQGVHKDDRLAYYHKPGFFFETIKNALAQEVGIVSWKELSDPVKRSRLAKHIEFQFAETNPMFFVACVIRMHDVFPRFVVNVNGKVNKLSSEYEEIFKMLLLKNEKIAVRKILDSIITIPSHVSTYGLREVLDSLDPVLRKQLFRVCLDQDGILLLINGGIFKTEEDSMDEEERSIGFSLIKKQLNKVGIGREFFSFVEKLHLTTDQKNELEDVIINHRRGEEFIEAVSFFSKRAQIRIVEKCDRTMLGILSEHLRFQRNLPRVIAERLIENGFRKSVADHPHVFDDLSPAIVGRLAIYREISKKIEESPSRTVRRMKEALIEELFISPDPKEAYDRVEGIFMRNHIPLAGKIFLIFETIYGDSHIQRAFSPTLKDSSPRQAGMLIYKDLFNIHLDTGNPSLREYLVDLQDMLPLLERVRRDELAGLSEEQQKKIEDFFRRVFILNEVSTYHKQYTPTPTEVGDIRVQLKQWEASLGVHDGQSLHARLEEMFLKPAHITSIEEALTRMDSSKKRADKMNREVVASNGDILALREGDLLKGVESSFFLSYLQNGNVAKEFLGYAAASDGTVLDTDVSRVLAADMEEGNKSALEKSLAHQYGDIILVIRPTPDRFLQTSNKGIISVHDQIHGKTAPYELFQAPVADEERHYAIRTGVPFTEVRWIIMKAPRRRELLDLKMDIVANGYYVAIADLEGKILFPPEEFNRLKNLYAGSSVMPDERLIVDTVAQNTLQERILSDLQREIGDERPVLEKIKIEIEGRVKEALIQAGVPSRISREFSIGAEVMNTGSTSRFTSVPGEVVDFDIIIRLDENDLMRQGIIQQKLDAILPGKLESGAVAQWRRSEVVIYGKSVDVDITFLSKPEVEGVFSHTMAEERLRSIEYRDKDAADRVRANIVLAKQVLRRAGVYKKLDGGIGGLGVENWILQSGGSFERARTEFLASALDKKGGIVPFEEFAQRYAIPDPGINMVGSLDVETDSEKKYHRHDNFVYFLQRQGMNGYERMVEALRY